MSDPTYPVYLETGARRTFAGAVAWPGWCRSGRGEQAALDTLLAYAPRYAAVLRHADLDFPLPTSLDHLAIAERLDGDRTTDFGAPAVAPTADARPLDDADLHRFRAILHAGWTAFDAARERATGHQLRKGPRGGGRDLPAIGHHVLAADLAYLGRVGHKPDVDAEGDLDVALSVSRRAILDALDAGARGELPTRGPRGGLRWSARYFVRRVTWHLLDHAWEIEDRAV